MYKSDNFSFLYPPSWTLQIANKSFVILSLVSPRESISDQFLENMNIGVESLSNSNINLSIYYKKSLLLLEKSFDNFELIDSTPLNISGLNTERVVYSFEKDGQIIKTIQIFFIVDSKAYVISFGALKDTYFEYLPIFQKILDSFKLEKETFSNLYDYNSHYFKLYPDMTYGFGIDSPAKWNEYQQKNSIIFAYPDKNLTDKDRQMMISILYYRAGYDNISYFKNSNATLNDVLIGEYEFLKNSYNGFKKVISDDVRLNELPAKEIVYTFNDPSEGASKAKEIILKSKDILYIITYSSKLDNYTFGLDIANTVINSFVILQ